MLSPRLLRALSGIIASVYLSVCLSASWCLSRRLVCSVDAEMLPPLLLLLRSTIDDVLSSLAGYSRQPTTRD